MKLHISIRAEPYGRFGFVIVDGRGAKVSGHKGCKSRTRAEHLARGAAERLCAANRNAYVASGVIAVNEAYAWLDPFDGLWRVGDRDSAGTHRAGTSRECATREAERANTRAECEVCHDDVTVEMSRAELERALAR